ncbi:cation:proton antiporter [Thermosynechococcus sp. JY1334]|uniref:cation:proton antiporter n=1 Tax=unclassified Thermosynechococcus TaxID=2622553 RepID=UPI00285DEF4F|nr:MULTISPECIES: cation:proton antiporter [unclassified Thermosynechococcus]MDR7898384.1 cation:proton antiporter [Thermosynechococcus sp. JY1332]MDR7905785.1 cation:proton antiporter [Thermosynechococcus sp. JY1334]WNC54468.1 cation:proton antiporter [Thermosynechococcus sp. JY1331]
MESSAELTALFVITVVLGIGAQVTAHWLRLPSIVLLLLAGILSGPSGLGLVHPEVLGEGLEVLVPLCVALILFEGGLSLDLSRADQDITGSLWKLVTLGGLVTFVAGAMAAHWIGEFPWQLAFLYASVVVVTGPTVVGPLLRQVGVEHKLAVILEGEGVLIDPIGAILAVMVLNVVLNQDLGMGAIALGIIQRLAVGALIGGIGGWCLNRFLHRAWFLAEDLRNLLVLAVLWGLFWLSDQLVSESGLMMAVVLGLVLRWSDVPGGRLLRRFKGQLSTLSISVLFVLLAADLSIAGLLELGWSGVLTVLCLMFLIRPLGVVLCTWGSDLSWQQKAFLSWIAPRGIVAASVASLFSITLTNAGISGGDAIKGQVFLTILMTVFGQGLTARWVATQLNVRAQGASGVMIAGCTPLGRLLAQILRDRGEEVVMIDTDPEAVEQARREHLPVYLSSALDLNILQEAGITQLGTYLAVTSNTEVNAVLAQRVLEEFHPPRVLAALELEDCPLGLSPAFAPQLSIKKWNQYINTEAVRLGELVIEEERSQLQRQHLDALIRSGKVLPLLVERPEGLRVVRANEEWQVGDRLIYLLHSPKPHTLPAALISGWQMNTQVESVLVPSEAPTPKGT